MSYYFRMFVYNVSLALAIKLFILEWAVGWTNAIPSLLLTIVATSFLTIGYIAVRGVNHG